MSFIILSIDRLHPIKTEHELIRIGPKGDGSYLVPDCLTNIEAIFSPGVDVISEFEVVCAKQYGMKIYMADKSVEKPIIDLLTINIFLLKSLSGQQIMMILLPWTHG